MTTSAARTPAHVREAAGRARRELRGVEADAELARRRYAAVAAAHYQDRVGDDELDAAEQAYLAALGALRRSRAVVEGFGLPPSRRGR